MFRLKFYAVMFAALIVLSTAFNFNQTARAESWSWENISSVLSPENVSAVRTADPVVVNGLDSSAGVAVAGGVVPGLVAAEPQQQMPTPTPMLPPCSNTPTFAPGSEVAVGFAPASVALGDVDRDGDLTLPPPTPARTPLGLT